MTTLTLLRQRSDNR